MESSRTTKRWGQDNQCQGTKSPWFLFSQEPMTKAGYQAGSCGSLQKSGIKHRLGQKTQHKSARLCRINPSLLASEHTVLCAHGLPGGKQGAGLNGEQNGNLQCK